MSDQEQERLDSLVNKDGVGEDPAIRALQQLPGMSNADALDVALSLQQLIRGNAAMLENQREQGEELAKLRAEMARMDKNAIKWEEDRKRYLDDIDAQADKLRMSEEKREQLLAKESNNLRDLTEKAMAEARINRQMFDDTLAREPKEIITSPGVPLMVTEGGAIVAKIIPEEVRIKHRVWIFPPYEPVEVPKSVADFMRNRRRHANEDAERKAALKSNMEAHKLDAEMVRIDEKYKTHTERVAL